MTQQISPYDSNLELFARDNPLQAALLDTIDCSNMELCTTEAGELNIVDNRPEGKRYLYAPEGAYKESELWATIPPLQQTDALFVFGLGLGYYFFPLKKWLEEDPKRQLVFLEDDLRVIRLFLTTDWAGVILNHPQVLVKAIPEVTPDEEGWMKLRESMGTLPLVFSQLRSNISALQGYFLYRFSYFHQFATQWLSNLSQGIRQMSEFVHDPYKRFKNFYTNLPYLAQTAPGEMMNGALRGIPAILCGAGRSLDKQLPLLSGLFDKAFLMAPASSMNPLSASSIVPHVGGGVDPTNGQLSRLMSRSGNDVPLFYSGFYNYLAFEFWHGPKIHISLSSGYGIPKWFEKTLERAKGESLIAGVSTSNYLLEAAAFLGCNPIVLVGMDLSFHNGKRYSEGVFAHPTDERRQHEAVSRTNDGLITFPGYGGKDVVTNRQWFQEAACISAFRLRHPEITVVNCTEGGMNIIYVEDKPFEHMVKESLGETWDIQGWFHGEVVNASVMAHGESAVFFAIAEWERSLLRCRELLDNLIAANENGGPESLWQNELHEEAAYKNFLSGLNDVYEVLRNLERRGVKRRVLPEEYRRYERLYELDRWRYLREPILNHLEWLREGVAAYNSRKAVLEKIIDGAITVGAFTFHHEGDLYEANEGRLRIEDHDLAVSIAAEFDPPHIPENEWPKGGERPPIEARIGIISGVREGQTLYFYENGAVKAEAYYHRGRLHGPWSFFDRQGELLSRSWFVEGVREGKSWLYYSGGKLYSCQGYRSGKRHGRQLYFYPSGVLKSLEHHTDGILDGPLTLYHENGRVMLQQNYVEGKLQGDERFYDIEGNIFAEAKYENGHAVGVSRRWHSNRGLAREVTHHPDGDRIVEWDEQGVIVEHG